MALFEGRQPNHYTIRKGGQTKIIHQLPGTAKDASRLCGDLDPDPDELPTSIAIERQLRVKS